MIRVATQHDVTASCQLLNDIIEIGGTTAYEQTLTEEEFASHFLIGNDCMTCCVCVDNDEQILGFQALSIHPNLPSQWGDIATFARTKQKVKGVGTQLFGFTRQFAEDADIHVINATIRADNQSGLSYYAKMGFVDYHINKAVPLTDGTLVDRISKRFDVRQ